GRDITELPPEERGIGFVYQDYSLFPHLTIEENVRFGLDLRKVPRPKAGKKVREVMRLLDISGLAKRYPSTLSGGEQQKTALARALVLDPKVLLLDEPLSAVDAQTRKRLRGELKRIHGHSGVTTVHVTHDHEEATLLGDRIGVMSAGEIIQVGKPDEIFRKPKSEFVADFVGVENILEGRTTARGGITRVDVGGGVVIEAIGERRGEVKVCIRPEDIIVAKRPIKSSGRNLLKGRVTEVSDRGTTVRLRVDTGRDFVVTITKKSFTDMKLKIGSRVYLAFKASAVHLI
ncbi:MAG: ABC transporter ATP-binding protein, partial [Candidatus Hadarchaeota archaeon]|nr:ABC transporter ATP-binding protein [Candidatus Hadarchaeota archaeon]